MILPETFQPASFLEGLGGVLVSLAVIAAVASMWPSVRAHAIRVGGLLLVVALSVFSGSAWTYFAALFIVATTVTELEFLQNLAAIVRGDKNWFDYQKSRRADVPPVPARLAAPSRSAMEFKILNTLFTKQVNKWPDRSQWFAFSIGSSTAEYAQFREAAYKLVGEGKVREVENGMFALTEQGFTSCKAEYTTYPADQWWPEESMSSENLKRVTAGG